ncbi:MAG: hypothetical protein ABI673_02140 [Novosphingobium sp.]
MPKLKLRALAVASMSVCLAFAASPVAAGVATKEGFAFPREKEAKIIMFRPDVQVGTLRTGGVDEANADWTTLARGNMQTAFETAAEAREAKISFMGEPDGENAKQLNDFRALFQVVSTEAMNHGLFNDRLATKKIPPAVQGGAAKMKFDWTLGQDARKLKEITGADYAMFVYTHDAYGSTGRKVAQLMMAGLFGAYIAPGVHLGYAGMVDLETGDLVWLNADIAMGGDLREKDGAEKRVKELLRAFPKRDSPPAPAIEDKASKKG